MPINLLGEPKRPIKKIPESTEIAMHLPEKEQKRIERAQKKAAKKAKKEKVVEAQKTEFEEVNLIRAFKIYLLKRRLTFIAIFAILLLAIAGIAVYFLYFYKPQPKIVLNLNKPVNTNALPVNVPLAPPTPSTFCGDGICNNNETCTICDVDCGSCPAVVPVTPPLVIPPAPPQPLPNTELAPLRGALIKFANETAIYLVDWNGELRPVDMQTVSFANGQKAKQISLTEIYTIASRFQDTRRGLEVVGFIPWDPRVLTQEELEPFVK
ncbi:MAG: hypothetical protein WC460_06355 [Patescibacteria group bacterium]